MKTGDDCYIYKYLLVDSSDKPVMSSDGRNDSVADFSSLTVSAPFFLRRCSLTETVAGEEICNNEKWQVVWLTFCQLMVETNCI